MLLVGLPQSRCAPCTSNLIVSPERRQAGGAAVELNLLFATPTKLLVPGTPGPAVPPTTTSL